MWITFDQIEELGLTRRWIEKQVSRGAWVARVTERRGRNGKPVREVLFSSLPSELQWRYQQRQRDQAAIETAENKSTPPRNIHAMNHWMS